MHRILLLIPCILLLCGCTEPVEKQPKSILVLRPAEYTPGEGLTEMTNPASGEKLYLHDTVIVSNADIASASLDMNAMGSPVVSISLKKQAARRFADATEKYLMKPVSIS